jgi:CheY-like chemotaxis protein
MPGMDGWAVLAALKDDPQTVDIPVLMLTILDDKSLGFALGASEYLTKPIDRSRLTAVVKKYATPGSAHPVLVVEDDHATRSVLRRSLRRQGWEVAEAENGRAALERIAERRPELVILDLMMPEMDGFEFLEALRELPEARSVPVVVITAKELTEDDRRRLNGSVERVLQKGANTRDEILAEVRKLMSAQAAIR